MCVLKAEMRLLKLDIRGKRGGVAAVFSSFLCDHSEWEKPYYIFLQALISISRL